MPLDPKLISLTSKKNNSSNVTDTSHTKKHPISKTETCLSIKEKRYVNIYKWMLNIHKTLRKRGKSQRDTTKRLFKASKYLIKKKIKNFDSCAKHKGESICYFAQVNIISFQYYNSYSDINDAIYVVCPSEEDKDDHGAFYAYEDDKYIQLA